MADSNHTRLTSLWRSLKVETLPDDPETPSDLFKALVALIKDRPGFRKRGRRIKNDFHEEMEARRELLKVVNAMLKPKTKISSGTTVNSVCKDLVEKKKSQLPKYFSKKGFTSPTLQKHYRMAVREAAEYRRALIKAVSSVN